MGRSLLRAVEGLEEGFFFLSASSPRDRIAPAELCRKLSFGLGGCPVRIAIACFAIDSRDCRTSRVASSGSTRGEVVIASMRFSTCSSRLFKDIELFAVSPGCSISGSSCWTLLALVADAKRLVGAAKRTPSCFAGCRRSDGALSVDAVRKERRCAGCCNV